MGKAAPLGCCSSLSVFVNVEEHRRSVIECVEREVGGKGCIHILKKKKKEEEKGNLCQICNL